MYDSQGEALQLDPNLSPDEQMRMEEEAGLIEPGELRRDVDLRGMYPKNESEKCTEKNVCNS